MTLEDRIRATASLDVAGLLDDERNELRALIRHGQAEEADRRLSWWEEALNVGLADDPHLAGSAERHPNWRTLAQGFRLQHQRLRRAGFDHLQRAIQDAERAQFMRLRCLAKAYAYAAREFLVTVSEAAALKSQQVALRQKRDENTERRYPVLWAHLEFRATSREPDAAAVQVRCGLHQLSRSDSVLKEIHEREAERNLLLKHLREVRARCYESGSFKDAAGPSPTHPRRALADAEARLSNIRRQRETLEIQRASESLEHEHREFRTKLPRLRGRAPEDPPASQPVNGP